MIFFEVIADFYRILTDSGLVYMSKNLKFELCEGDMHLKEAEKDNYRS